MSGQGQRRGGADSSKSVFVGNIPYDATEEQLTEVFHEAGPVVSFRLVFDKDTGKPKGYGFCEYRDAQTALSAIRNLNGIELNGRPLRVDFAENEKGMEMLAAAQAAGQTQPSTTPSWGGAPSTPGNQVTAGPTISSMQSNIHSIIDGISPNQLFEIMIQLKSLTQKKPEQIRQLLSTNPQIAYAVLQAQIQTGMISSQAAQQLQTTQTPAAQLGQMQGYGQYVAGPQSFNPMMSQYGNINPQIAQAAAAQGINPLLLQQPQVVAHLQQQILQQAAVAAQQQQAQQQQKGIEQFPDEQKQLLEKVMKLTPEQIEKLPPQKQQQINQLRAQVMRYYPGNQ